MTTPRHHIRVDRLTLSHCRDPLRRRRCPSQACNNVGGTPGFGGCQKVGNCGAMKCPGTCKALGCTWNSATGSCSATCDAVCAAAQWDGLASPVPPLNGVVSGCTFTNVTSTLIGYAGATSGVVLLPSTGLHSYKFKMGVGFVASPPIPLQPFVSTITGGIVTPPFPPTLTPLAASTGDIFEYVINTTYNAVPPSYGITVYINGALQATGFIPVAGEVDGLRFGISGGPGFLPLTFEQVC